MCFFRVILKCFVLLSFGACTSVQRDIPLDTVTVQFDLKQAAILNFDSVFIIEDLILLENSMDLPISNLNRIIKKKSSYWILTPEFVLITDIQGKVTRIISDLGEGPGEFQSLDDIRWNESSQLMEILDGTSGKILSYSEKGDFQKEWKNKFLYAALSFTPVGRNYLIYGGAFFDGEGDRLLEVFPESGEKIKGFLPINKERNFLNVLNHDVFFESQSGLDLFFSDRDTIYSITSHQVSPRVIFNAGANKVPEIVYQGDFTNILEYREELRKGNYITLFTIQPTEDAYYLRFRYQSDFYPAILEKSSNRLKLIRNWNSDFGVEFRDLSSFFTFAPIGSDETHIYFSVDPYEIKSAIDELKDHPNLSAFLEANPRIREIYERFDEYENPYILKLRIREF